MFADMAPGCPNTDGTLLTWHLDAQTRMARLLTWHLDAPTQMRPGVVAALRLCLCRAACPHWLNL